MERSARAPPGRPPRTTPKLNSTPSIKSPPGRKSPSRRSPVRKSPSRRSPARKSPSRRSPARKSSSRRSSPARSSPIRTRKSPGRKSPARKSPGGKISPKSNIKLVKSQPISKTIPIKISTSPSSPLKKDIIDKLLENKPSVFLKNSLPQKLSPKSGQPIPFIKMLKTSPSTQSVSTSYSSSTMTTSKTTETVNIGPNSEQSVKLDTSGDSEIAKLTSIASFVRRSVSKNLTPTLSVHHLTPTPTTEQSRHSRSVSHSAYEEEEDNYSRTEYSDNEDEEKFESFHIASNMGRAKTKTPIINFVRSTPVSCPKEFGYNIGGFMLMLLIPAITLILQYVCSRNECKFEKGFDLKKINITTILKNWFSTETAVVYFCFTTAICLISSFPFGRVVRLKGKDNIEYYFNSIAVTILATAGYFGAELYFKYSVANFILNNYLRFFAISLVSAFVVATCLYLKSRKSSSLSWNHYARSGKFCVDYFLGREINPKWFGVTNIKLSFYRVSLIVSLLFSITFIYTNLEFAKFPVDKQLSNAETVLYAYENVKYDPTALLTSVLYLIYTLDWIVFEHHLTSSFELQHEGVGAMLLLRYATTPFLLASVPKYALDFEPILVPSWAVALICVAFGFGMLLKRFSNGLKYEYRMNPTNPKFSYIDTVTTYQDRRLLLAGWWGTVRQPNYAGDILSLIALASPICWNFAFVPIISILLLIIVLIHRIGRVHNRNFQRYNAIWPRFCTRVRYTLIPNVY